MSKTHDLNYLDLKLTITGTYHSGRIGDYENPPEPQQFEIDAVYCEGVNLTELFDNVYSSFRRFEKCKDCNKTTKVWKINTMDELEYLIIEKYYE
jgi:hypothetical protein